MTNPHQGRFSNLEIDVEVSMKLNVKKAVKVKSVDVLLTLRVRKLQQTKILTQEMKKRKLELRKGKIEN